MSSTESQASVALPPFVEERFEKINALTNVPVDEIRKEYLTFWQQNDAYLHGSSFVDDEQRHRYCDGVVWARYRSLRPSKEFEVVPVGYDSWKLTTSGKKRSAIYVALKGPKGLEKKQIPLFDTLAELYKTVNLGQGYKVKLVEFKDNGGVGADRRTIFENPQLVNINMLSLFQKLGALEVPDLMSAVKFPSRMQKGSTGEFVDSLDWRIVRGWISNMNDGTTKKGYPWANVTLIDPSLGTEETVDKETGKVKRAGLTVWLDGSLQKYATDSEVYFVGTISVNKEGDASMSGINVIPIHAFPVAK